MDLHDFFSDELPHEAATLIDQFELATEELRQSTTQKTAKLQQRLNERIDELRSEANQQIADLEQRTEDRLRTLFRELLGAVKPLQEKYLRTGNLDAALTLRERMRQMRICVGEVRADTGYLRIGAGDVGKTFYYEVTGTTEGSVYGTDVYTTDTALAATAVHAGLLKPGQKGIIRVTILKENHPSFQGSQRNGVTSYDWSSSYPAFRVSKA